MSDDTSYGVLNQNTWDFPFEQIVAGICPIHELGDTLNTLYPCDGVNEQTIREGVSNFVESVKYKLAEHNRHITQFEKENGIIPASESGYRNASEWWRKSKLQERYFTLRDNVKEPSYFDLRFYDYSDYAKQNLRCIVFKLLSQNAFGGGFERGAKLFKFPVQRENGGVNLFPSLSAAYLVLVVEKGAGITDLKIDLYDAAMKQAEKEATKKYGRDPDKNPDGTWKKSNETVDRKVRENWREKWVAHRDMLRDKSYPLIEEAIKREYRVCSLFISTSAWPSDMKPLYATKEMQKSISYFDTFGPGSSWTIKNKTDIARFENYAFNPINEKTLESQGNLGVDWWAFGGYCLQLFEKERQPYLEAIKGIDLEDLAKELAYQKEIYSLYNDWRNEEREKLRSQLVQQYGTNEVWDKPEMKQFQKENDAQFAHKWFKENGYRLPNIPKKYAESKIEGKSIRGVPPKSIRTRVNYVMTGLKIRKEYDEWVNDPTTNVDKKVGIAIYDKEGTETETDWDANDNPIRTTNVRPNTLSFPATKSHGSLKFTENLFAYNPDDMLSMFKYRSVKRYNGYEGDSKIIAMTRFYRAYNEIALANGEGIISNGVAYITKRA